MKSSLLYAGPNEKIEEPLPDHKPAIIDPLDPDDFDNVPDDDREDDSDPQGAKLFKDTPPDSSQLR